MNNEDQTPEDQEDIPDELSGLSIITLMYDSCSDEPPMLDLGNCSPWVAYTMLRAAFESLQILIPPTDISYRGEVICRNTFEVFDDDDD